MFEESFTIPLHKFNLSLILSQSKIENVEDTVVVTIGTERILMLDNHGQVV